MNRPTSDHNAGLSRIEVFVVLAVIAGLVALIVPAVQSARETARRKRCGYSLEQIAIALHNYHDLSDQFPYGCVGPNELPIEKRWSWQIGLVPQFGNERPILDLDHAWDDPTIRPLEMFVLDSTEEEPPFKTALLVYPFFQCPSVTPKTAFDGQPNTDYVGLGGLGADGPYIARNDPQAGTWAYEMRTTFRDCTDGTANTLLLIETGRNNGCWLACGPATVRPFDPIDEQPIGSNRQFGGLHDGGAMAVYVDGHTEFLSESTSPEVFQALVTIAGGEQQD